MKTGVRLRAGAVAVGMLILVAGCTSSTADGPTTTPLATITGTPSAIDPSSLLPSSSPAPPSPSPSVVETSPPASTDPAAQEAADRAAIEAQWIAFWEAYRDMIRTPDDGRDKLLSAVVTSPLKETMIEEARSAEADGQDNYGSVQHRVFWDIPIDGNPVATIADCQDQTGTGVVDLKTGSKITEGVDRIEIRGQMVRGDDGIWRVQALFEVGDSDC